MDISTVLQAIEQGEIKFVDFRFTDLRGREQHLTMPVSAINVDIIKYGKMIDGSSFKGWQAINKSDLILRPDGNELLLDPFFQDNTLFIRCNIVDPHTMKNYTRCPRSLAQRAEEYLKSTGIADQAYFGPESEFFMFDQVRWETSMSGAFYKIDAEEGYWNSSQLIDGGNIGHRPGIKGGYGPLPPSDSSQDIRSAMSLTLEQLGVTVEAHHHEVATANQCELATRFNSLTKKADELQILKYVIHNVAHNYGKTATFMPKPLVGDNGSGLHCHQSLFKDGVNIFSGDEYAGLSQTALYYIGGIIKHARALNVFTNPATNSYKRLVPGFEAPVLLAYSWINRSAAIRIPHVESAKSARIEVRFPDATANPYLAFAAMMMAGLDGIKNKIHPGQPMDEDLFSLSAHELKDVPSVCGSLEEAVEAVRKDQEFLLAGDVFSEDLLDSYLQMKIEEIQQIRSLVHPYEFELYYSN